jgi:glucosamine kinase
VSREPEPFFIPAGGSYPQEVCVEAAARRWQGRDPDAGLARYRRMSLPYRTPAGPLLLGIDGGGTRCRGRLATAAGATLAEAVSGPANIRYGMEESFAAVFQAGEQCLTGAGLSARDLQRVIACFALAGASEPSHRAAAERHAHPYRDAVVTSDAHAACVGAHAGRDGGVITIGTGSIGWATIGGRQLRIGGWGPAVSDEGSGAWLGREAMRRVLWAHDGLVQWTDLLTALFARFHADPHAIVQWSTHATPRDFGELAPLIVEQATARDSSAVELMRAAAAHIEAIATRLLAAGAPRLALLGGLAGPLEAWLTDETRRHLVPPAGDALDGALRLAGAAAGLPPP